jgi:hypothetical protein
MFVAPVFVTIYHPTSGGTAQVAERTLAAWQRAGWTTTPPKSKRPRAHATGTPTTASPAMGEVPDDSIAGPSSTPTEEI